MLHFSKAHAYGNDFLYVRADEVGGVALDALARELCDRHTGVGADGLIVYEQGPSECAMRLINADGSPAEVSGNGVRALGALVLREHAPIEVDLVVQTQAGPKRLTRTGHEGARQTFRAAMGQPVNVQQRIVQAAGERVPLTTLDMGNPQAVVLGPLPDRNRFLVLGAALERHPDFPAGTNVEFAEVEAPNRVRIVIWERGVGPTLSSGTGSCAALVAAAASGEAAREADVIAPGGTQRVEWQTDGVFLTGWAEVLCEGEWLRPLPAR